MEHTAWVLPFQVPGLAASGNSNPDLWAHTEITNSEAPFWSNFTSNFANPDMSNTHRNVALCVPSAITSVVDPARGSPLSKPSLGESLLLGQSSVQLYQSQDTLLNPATSNCTDPSTLPSFPLPAMSAFDTIEQSFPDPTPPISGRVTRDTMSPTSQTPVTTESTKRSFTAYNCGTPGCTVSPFRTKSAWRRHMIRHDGRFKCKADLCQSLRAFSTSNDLDRHRRSVHGEGPVLFCQFTTCKYAEGGAKGGFARLDNLRAHLRREHPTLDPLSAVANSVQMRQEEAPSMEHQESPPGEVQSPPALTAAPFHQSPSFSPPQATGIETVVSVAKPRSLQEENTHLQERVSKLESENEMLWKLIDTLRKA